MLFLLIKGSFAIIQKDFLETMRAIDHLIFGLLSPMLMFFVLSFLMGYGEFKGNFFTEMGFGIIYMNLIYSSFFISGEPLYRELIWKTSAELYLAPLPNLYIVLGKFLAGFIKSLVIGLISLMIIYFFIFHFSISYIHLFCLILLSANFIGFSILLACLIPKWPVYAGAGGFLGILTAVLAGVFIPLSKFPFFVRIISHLLPTTYVYQLFIHYYIGQTIYHLKIVWIISILFPLISILLSSYLYNKKLNQNVLF